MLAQEVVGEYQGKVSFVSENFGSSKLAEQFGVTRYPAVFVDDVLVARPRDFGFYGEGETAGRYTPWRNAQSQAHFKSDLKRMVDLVLAGKKDQLNRERAETSSTPDQVSSLPEFSLEDLSGAPITSGSLRGRIVIVEFWATWCPPCRSTLQWLGDLKKKYGADVEVLALAVESPDDKVRSTVGSLSPDIRWAISQPDIARSFGDITAVPTLLMFDKEGKTSQVIYGAPPDLHTQAETALGKLLSQKP